jgi:Domain of unknown function (DUF222)
VEIRSAAQSEIICALENIRRVRARVDAGEVALARRLRELTPLADDDVSRAAQRPSRHGDKIRNRAETTALIPGLGDAFDTGELSGEHVDAVSKAVKAAPPEVRNALREAVSELVPEIVSGLTPDDVSKRLSDETKRLEADDGVARLERQRRATRLKTWTDKHDGMFRISGSFDPYSGLAIQGRLNAAMAAMFANGIPEMAPDDPGERQDFLRGLAFMALTAGVPTKDATPNRKRAKQTEPDRGASPDHDPRDPEKLEQEQELFEPNHDPFGRDHGRLAETCDGENGGENDGEDHDGEPDLAWAPFALSGPPRFGRAEVIVVVDYTKIGVDGRPTIDWGSPISLPFRCLEDLAQQASVHTVVVNNGNVVDPDGDLNLGRTTRLANRPQRRALKALYATCAVPGCSVRFEFTKPHHLKWWRNGGLTDLLNLLPLCTHHHACAHNGWIFALGPNRELTITFPNGKTLTTGPPNRNNPA